MKDFKQNVKMMCAGGHYKEGGDVAQDKKMIKKAFKMHDDQLHERKHTDLSKLKKGGKVKKMADGKLSGALSDKDVANQLREFQKSGKDVDPGIARSSSKPYVNMDPGMSREPSNTINIPGVGTAPRAPVQMTPNGRGVLLKKGGKTKRGKK